MKVNLLTFIKQFLVSKLRFLRSSTLFATFIPQTNVRRLGWIHAVFVFVAFSLMSPQAAHSSVEKTLEPPAGLEALTKPRLVGQHLFRFFGLEIYHISLWSSPDWTPEKWKQHSFALSLVYSRTMNGEEIANRSISEIKKQMPLSDDTAQMWMSQLRVLMPSVKPGDRLTGIYQPSGSLVFWMGSKKIGEIKDAALSEAFMSIWLSTKTSEPQMRKKLLGMYLE